MAHAYSIYGKKKAKKDKDDMLSSGNLRQCLLYVAALSLQQCYYKLGCSDVASSPVNFRSKRNSRLQSLLKIYVINLLQFDFLIGYQLSNTHFSFSVLFCRNPVEEFMVIMVPIYRSCLHIMLQPKDSFIQAPCHLHLKIP